MKILVCDADYKNSLGIVRALGKIGHEVSVLANTRNSLCSKSKYCRSEFLVPTYDDRNYRPVLLRLLEKEKPGLIIPVGTSSYKKLSELQADLPDGTKMIMAAPDSIGLCMSKEKTYKFADKIGIPVPRTIYPECRDNVQALSSEISFPCVIKGRFETGQNIVDYAQDGDDLTLKYERICNKHDLTAPKELPLIQEYIGGDGYGFFAIYDRGNCGPTFQHHRLREFPPTGGMSVAAESSRHPLVSELGRKLLDALKWHGVAMVEFKMNQKGEPILMEINPKFWGSLDLALEAGVNFPAAMVDIALGKPLIFNEEYKYPFKYHWPLHGDLLYPLLRPQKLPAVLWDCLCPGTRSNLWLSDDLKGTLGIVVSSLTKLARRF